MTSNKKVALIILDGWGCGKEEKSNVIASTPTPHWDNLLKKYPNSTLKAAGEDVGLPHGQMGNSEVGHLNIGAGRVLYQDLVKINKACEDDSIKQNEAIIKAFSSAKENNKSVHLLGLVSDGGVHSSMKHLFKLCEIGADYDIKNLFVHCFTDGRDTDPKSGIKYLTQLDDHLKKTTGSIGSVIGRYFAMDRDQRWDRIKKAYDLMVNGKGTSTSNILGSVEESYKNNVTDEFIEPLINGQVDAKIKEGDTVIFFNFRNDRPKELTIALTQKDLIEHGMKTLDLNFFTITPYDSSFKGLNIIFDKDNVTETLGEVVSKAGKKQLRIAETEKFAHVTFFFSGGREQAFDGESRILINSPKVATYDLKPEMAAPEVKDAVILEIQKKELDFICLNFANGDMVGHTGIYDAIEKAVTTVDQCVGELVTALTENGYEAIIIADHGNADFAVNADGSPNTAHTLNPVPFVFISDRKASISNGILADVAPSICHLMGLTKPEAMSGKNLIHLE